MATALLCIEPPASPAGSLAEQALESISEAIVIVAIGPLHLPIVLANAAARRTLGAKIRDDSLYRYLGARANPPLETLLGELARGRKPLRRPISWRTNTGEYQFDTACQLVAGSTGEQLAMLRFQPDPTPPDLRCALDVLPTALMLLDRHLKITFANAAARHLNAPDGAELLGASALSVRPTAALALEVFRRALGGSEYAGPVEWRDPQGRTLAYDLRLHCVQGAADPLGLLVTATPTDRRPSATIAAQSDWTTWVEREQLEMSRRERRRIGRDLHDGLGQELTGVALMLRGLARRLEHDAPQLLEPVNEIVAHANRAIESARSLARGLLPVTDQAGGLLAALRRLAERGRALYALDVQCRSEITPPLALDDSAANHLYRIAQEALTNAARHARATRVEILLRVVAGHFLLEIADDGIGLSTAPPGSSGLGLGILRERALQLGAHLEFMENSPSGTRVRVVGTTQRRDG